MFSNATQLNTFIGVSVEYLRVGTINLIAETHELLQLCRAIKSTIFRH